MIIYAPTRAELIENGTFIDITADVADSWNIPFAITPAAKQACETEKIRMVEVGHFLVVELLLKVKPIRDIYRFSVGKIRFHGWLGYDEAGNKCGTVMLPGEE